MELKDVVYETRGQAAWITLNRPRMLNALSAEMLASLRLAYEAASDDRNVRAVVISGAGRGFCAGAYIHVPVLGLRVAVRHVPASSGTRSMASIFFLATIDHLAYRTNSRPSDSTIAGC
jgi:enoyl-CoA hydratase/carnithine racemase